MSSHQWSVKHSGVLVDAELLAAERRYLACNPYHDWIRETFRLAGTDYGRLDFGVFEGRPQAFEINTNPTFGPRRHGDPGRVARERARQGARWLLHQRFYGEARHALRALAPLPRRGGWCSGSLRLHPDATSASTSAISGAPPGASAGPRSRDGDAERTPGPAHRPHCGRTTA